MACDRSFLPTVLGVGLLAPAVAQSARPDAEPALDRELSAIRGEVDAGRAAAAGVRLTRLLQREDHRPWARARREALVEEARRIAFWSAYAPPSPGELISGELREWVPRSGVIALAYRHDTLADFVAVEEGILVHPLVFCGDYTLALRGDEYPADAGPRLLVAAGATASYCVEFGRAGDGAKVQVRLLTPSASECVGEADARTLCRGKAFRVGVRVAANVLQVTVDGEAILRVAKRSPEFGQFGLWPCAFAELEVRGQSTTAWLDGVRDRRSQAAMRRFAATFDPASVIPSWLLGPPAEARALPAYPCPIAEANTAELAACVHLLEQHRFDDCLARAAAAAGADLPPPILMWLRALAFAGKREFTHALLCVDELLRVAPDFVRAQELAPRLLWGTGQRQAALAAARALVAREPDCVDAVTALVSFELCSGRREAAADLCADARARGLHSPELDRVAGVLHKAERGPDWSRRFTYRSRHCEVASDIDHATCIEVARTLERALATFSAELGAPARALAAARVFVFAGEDSYRAYLDDVIGTVPIHTTGLYCHSLGQLLLWQTADRARMLQTVWHEGLHWYLEQVMPDPPRWFNEGLAQFYEDSTGRGPRAGTPALRRMRIRLLRERGMVPLAEFFARRDGEFYADPALAYAQSWAIVAMLREGTPAQRALFTGLFAALARGEPAAAVVAALLPAKKLAALERELRAWVDSRQ